MYNKMPADAVEYYRQIEREVKEELEHGQDPVLSAITLKTFVSTSKGRKHNRAGQRANERRIRRKVKEITLIKYGSNYHQPHRFDWWIAGLELLGDVEDVETKMMERVLGNQAFNLNGAVK